KYLIVKFDIAMPGREKTDNTETKLYTKEDYKASKKQGAAASVESYDSEYDQKAAVYLEGLGGADNIVNVANCATRLRVTVADANKVQNDTYFKEHGG